MNNETLDQLSGALGHVGFEVAADVGMPDKLISKHWRSNYAHVYVVNVDRGVKIDWPALLIEVDRKVLNSLKADELRNGGVLDAHVCFLIDESMREQVIEQVDDRVIRNVCRKYWIESNEGFQGFQTRLALLGVSRLSFSDSESPFGLPPSEQEWVDRLVECGPDAMFQELVSKHGCRS